MKKPRHQHRKHWSQNFFTDQEVLRQLIEPMQISPNDHILEIGPGQGMMTELLLTQAAKVTAVEIDPRLCHYLEKHFANHKNFHLIQQDILRFDLLGFVRDIPRSQRKVIANIPYHITTPLLLNLLNEKAFKSAPITEQTPLFEDIYLMVQKEVAERIVAEPGTKAWGALSIAVNFAAETGIQAIIPRTFFHPRPKVDSAILHLKPLNKDPLELENRLLFWQLVKGIFQYRRKTLRNLLKLLDYSEAVRTALEQNWNLQIRGEILNLTELALLANQVNALQEST